VGAKAGVGQGLASDPFVIPAQAGIQSSASAVCSQVWIPAFAGMTRLLSQKWEQKQGSAKDWRPIRLSVGLKLDDDILSWFKSQGRGYQTRINAVLRRYVEAQRKGG
jgi:uncharacterized protein (DUF4415 family)